MKKNFLKFWGTRGSCAVSGPEYLRFGGNTCCLEARYGDTHLIFDAGTGIRPLGNQLSGAQKIDLFLSHTHWDHIIGLPYFEPLFRKEVQITLWAPHGKGRSCHQLMEQLLAKEFFPVSLDQIQAKLEFRTLHPKAELQIGSLTLDFHLTRHPGTTACFKLKTPHQTIGYTTDNEIDLSSQKSFIDFHKKCDIFIHEAQYFSGEYRKRTGWGHSSLANAIALVNEVHPASWLVSHHDPRHTDKDLEELEAFARSQPLPCPVSWIPDGYTVDLH